MTTMRRFQFDGNDNDYIAFLENTVLESTRIIERYKTFLPGRNSQSSDGRERCTTSFQEDSTPSRQKDEGYECGGLQIIEYDPRSQDNFITTAGPKSEYRWQRELNQMLERIPSLDSWENERLKFPIGNDTVLKAAVNHQPFIDFSLSSRKLSHTQDIILVLEQYCSFTKGVLSEANVSQKTSSFLELIFVSLCAVALKTVEDVQSIYKIMKLYISNAHKRHLDKLIRGAIWANQCISALSKTEWGSRAIEVFLLAGQSVSFYGRYAENLKSQEYFLAQMGKKAKGIRVSGIKAPDPVLTIPLIVEKLFGDSLSLAAICERLGYCLEYVSTCRPYFEEVLKTPTHKRRTASSGATADETCSVSEACPQLTDLNASATSQARKCRRLDSICRPSSDVHWSNAGQHRRETDAHSQSASGLQDPSSRNTSFRKVNQRNFLRNQQYANDRWTLSGHLGSHEGTPFGDPQSLIAGDYTNGILPSLPNTLPYGPQPDEPGSLAVAGHYYAPPSYIPDTLPYGPQSDEPGSLAVAGHYYAPPSYIPDTLPYGPQPDEPGSLAVADHPFAVTQLTPNSFPRGPQPGEPGSLAVEDYFNVMLSSLNNKPLYGHQSSG